MRLLFASIVAFLTFTFATVQPGFAQSDKTILSGWIEEALSTEDRSVTIEGFSGALSSRAKLERLAITDSEGAWLEMIDATLEWNRAAVLRGEIDITNLSARSLRIFRRPVAQPSDLVPESASFQLPDLPVSINIDHVSVGTLTLDKELLGQAAAFSLEGSLILDAGNGSGDLSVIRTDDQTASLTIAGNYSNDTHDLELSLDLTEAAGGLLGHVLKLPDAPAVDLAMQGVGTLPDFQASLSLSTDEQTDITGTLVTGSLGDDTLGGNHFALDLNGDLTSFMPSQFHPFFGADANMSVEGERDGDGALSLSEFAVATQAMTIDGSLDLSSDYRPERFDLAFNLGAQTGSPVRLPISSAEVTLSRGVLAAHFASDESDIWSFDGAFHSLAYADALIPAGRIAGNGLIFPNSGNTNKTKVTGSLSAALVGLTDALGMPEYFGHTATSHASFSWSTDEPVQFPSISVLTGGAELAGEMMFEGPLDAFQISGRADISARSLDQLEAEPDWIFRGGQLQAGVSGSWAPLSSSFDVVLDATGQDLRLHDLPVRKLAEGSSDLHAEISRDDRGIHVAQAELRGERLRVSLDGDLKTSSSSFDLAIALTDIGDVTAGLSGPANAQGTLRQPDDDWLLDIAATGPGNSNLSLTGSVSPSLLVSDLKFTGDVPLALANSLLPLNASVDGRVKLNMDIRGPIAEPALSGSLATKAARAALPSLGVSLEGIDADMALSGNSARVSAQAQVAAGGSISINGDLGLIGNTASDLKMILTNLVYAQPPNLSVKLGGDLRLSGVLAQSPLLSGNLIVQESEIRVAKLGSGGSIPEITHIGDTGPIRATRARAGVVPNGQRTSGGGNALRLDLALDAPARNFVRGRGVDAEFGGAMRVGGTSAEPAPNGQLSLIRGRLNLLGKRFDFSEGLLSIHGSFEPTFNLIATTSTADASIEIEFSGTPSEPEVAFRSAPQLPEDEILAQLVLGKSIARISPLQAAQLASAIATLTDGGDTGVVAKIRDEFDLDDLDIITSEEGNVALRAGKYISDNAYADVTAGSNGQSEINLNLDISPTLTVRGSLESTGRSSIGFFVEKDY